MDRNGPMFSDVHHKSQVQQQTVNCFIAHLRLFFGICETFRVSWEFRCMYSLEVKPCKGPKIYQVCLRCFSYFHEIFVKWNVTTLSWWTSVFLHQTGCDCQVFVQPFQLVLMQKLWRFCKSENAAKKTGVMKLPIWVGIKQWKGMVMFKGFPLQKKGFVNCLGWCHICWPLRV